MTRRLKRVLGASLAVAALAVNCSKSQTPSGPSVPLPGTGPVPQVVLQRVLRANAPPCSGALPCTVAVGTGFDFEVAGQSPNGTPIAGFQWQAAWPGDSLADAPFEPDCRTGQFLPVADGLWRGGSARDSLPCLTAHFTQCTNGAPFPDTLFSVHGGVLQVRYGPRTTQFNGATRGRFVFTARVRDTEGRTSPFDTIQVVLGYPPATRFERVPACDCPHPPPNCSGADSVRAGWITGDANGEWTPDRWIRFCDGDTVPMSARLRFFARARDDRRDRNCTGDSAAAMRISYRFEWARGAAESRSMPFSRPVAEGTWQSPSGPVDGGSVSWYGTLPVDYVLYAAAADPNGRLDPTPDSLHLYGDFPPAVDSLEIAPVVVLIPRCPGDGCNFGDPVFGADTVAVYGTYLPDTAIPPHSLGFNEFVLPVRASGADHPSDRNLPRSRAGDACRILAWWYELQASPGDPPLPAMGIQQWIDDLVRVGETLDRQYFDSDLGPMVVALDTLDVGASGPRARLAAFAHGAIEFRVRARDTRSGLYGSDVLGLDPDSPPVERLIGNLGRVSPFAARSFVLRELADVRPLAPALRAAHVIQSAWR